MEFGKFSELTFVNGGAPAINDTNLNEIERVVKLTDDELNRSASVKLNKYLNYFYKRNTKIAINFLYYGDWTNHYPSQVDLSDESDYDLIGDECLKMENILNTAGWMSISATLASTVDLTVFYDGTASTTDDIIAFMFYISDPAAFANFEIRFGDDFSNCYFINLAGTFSAGWNSIFYSKSDFATVGAPTGWDTIDYVRIAPYANAGYISDYIYFQKVALLRQDPSYSGYSNVLQEYMGSVTGWENVFTITSDVMLIYDEYNDRIKRLGIMKIRDDVDYTDLSFYTDVISFISKWEFYCKYAGESACVTWYVDSDNYAAVYITSDTFYLEVVEATVSSNVNVALDISLLKNQRFYFYIEKDYQTFRAILLKDGEKNKILEYETSISASTSGDVYLGRATANGWSILTDCEIGNKAINYLTSEILPKMLRASTQISLANNTLQNIGNMFVYLKPNQMYKIEAYITASCGSTTPDIKIAWDNDGLSFQSDRFCSGPATNTTTVGATNMKVSAYNPTTQVSYGLDGTTNESYIYETFFVLSGADGAKLQLQAAQVTTDAGNPINVRFGSILATPITRDYSY